MTDATLDFLSRKVSNVILPQSVLITFFVCLLTSPTSLGFQQEVSTLQGNLPRLNYRDSQGSLLWSLPANNVLWKLDGPFNAGVVVVTAATPSNSILLNEGGVSIRGSGFPSAKLHVGTLVSQTEPGEVRIDPGSAAAPAMIYAVNANLPASMVLETQSPASSASVKLVTTTNSFSSLLGPNFAIRDNLNAVNPLIIVPGIKNSNSIVIKNGNIGFGITNPTSPLVLANGAKCSAGGVWTNASSRELKREIESLELDTALEALTSLKPVTYKYKSEDDELQAGFIAEDVPELVATKSRKELSPMDFVAVLTKVVQDQQSRIEVQEEKLNRQAEMLEQQQVLLKRLLKQVK